MPLPLNKPSNLNAYVDAFINDSSKPGRHKDTLVTVQSDGDIITDKHQYPYLPTSANQFSSATYGDQSTTHGN